MACGLHHSKRFSMRSSIVVALACALALASVPSAQPGDALKAAADALNAAKIKTLQFTGSGANFSVGQNFTPNDPWPRVTVKNYTASINYDTGSMRQELLREMSAAMPRGGGAPFTGDQRQNLVVSGTYAWNVPVPPPAPAGGAPAAGGSGGRGGAPPPAPAPGA